MARQFVVFALLALVVATAFAADAPSAAPTASPTKAPTTQTKAPAAAPKSSSTSAPAPKASSPVAEEPTPEDDYTANSPSESAEAPTVSSPPAPTPEADGPSSEGPGPEVVDNSATNVKLSIAGTVAAVGFFVFSLSLRYRNRAYQKTKNDLYQTDTKHITYIFFKFFGIHLK
ncbi:hypothetical protein Bca52824_042003 [Brassica carinata]|uniref:Uncharacterized protein n=1 Tax=Brassica carinata TaxID=52824 RepID=A0A8X7UYC1_BRACI|nr:hypothetical protein Bca52824_042003 [Brassica carinata]